jgi:hypothetical protein
MDGRSMIWVLNVVENILESSHVDDQPERIQAILKMDYKKTQTRMWALPHISIILYTNIYRPAAGDKQRFSNKVLVEL